VSRPYNLFVYGTLLSGEESHHLLEDAKRLGPARTLPVHTLYDLGEYPAMVAGGVTAIAGELYEVNEVHLAILDDFEGAPSLFQRARIELDDGRSATTYLWSGPPRGTVIESGDYRLRAGAGAGRSFNR
jgi:gamma-glutamylaminecyclotransferase